MDHDALVAEMSALREEVAGITDTVLAAVDGLVIVADTEDRIEPAGLAALAAAALGLGRSTTMATGQGSYHQTVMYSSGGCMAVYAVGDEALMAVLGDEGLNIGRLHHASQHTIERLNSVLYVPEHASR